MKNAKNKIIFLSILVVLAVSALIYSVLVPFALSKKYADEVHSISKPLESDFKALNESTEFYLLNNPDVAVAIVKDEKAYVSELVSASQRKIAALREFEENFETLPYSNFSGQYHKLRVIREQSQRFVGQSEDALSGYIELITYLEAFDQTTDEVMAELDNFNRATDINIYEGQSDAMRQIADKLRLKAADLSKVPRPRDAENLNEAAVAAINKAAIGFDDLAYGLSIPADDPIYAATRKIEEATTEMGIVKGESYDASLEQSRVIKNIQDLSEKLDLVLGVQES